MEEPTLHALRDLAMSWAVPLVRAYIRYAPFVAGKRSFWTRVVDPYFAWQSYEFVARTVFDRKIAGNTREMLQQFIYYFGVWEPHLTRWMAQRLAPGDTFVDVGANIGYFSLLASKVVRDSGTVVAIEPSPSIFSRMQSNLARNHARNVRALNMAVSNSKGKVSVFRSIDASYFTGETTIREEVRLRPDYEIEADVDTAPLSAILRPEELKNTRFIKIDAEGSEWSIVEGLGPLLTDGRTDLEFMVEISPEQGAKQGKRPEEIVETFREAGFNAYQIETNYDGIDYLPPLPERRPVRIQRPIENETNAVFSRQDSEML